jgi:hypothetical protein
MELSEIRYVVKNGRRNAHLFCDKCLIWILGRAFNRHRVKCLLKHNG